MATPSTGAMSVASAHSGGAGSARLIATGVLATATAAFFLHPLALLLFVSLVAIVTPTKDFKWLFLVAACALFTILNLSKQVDGDLVNYVALQDYIAQKPFFTLFNVDELRSITGTYRATEMGFSMPFWVISQVIPDGRTAIAIAVTLSIYIPTFLALALIGKSENWSRSLLITVAAFTFFAGINFIQSTHLIRQYVSSAILFYAFALFLSKHNRWAAFLALYACTVHNGSAPLVPLVGWACWLFRYREGFKLSVGSVILRIALVLLLFVPMMTIVPISQGALTRLEVPNIKAVHFEIVGALFVIAHIAIQMQKLRLRSLYYARIAFLVIYALSLCFFILSLPLFALRYFAYLEWLYGLLVGSIIYSWFRNAPGLRTFARFTIAMGAVAIFISRVAVAEWNYGPGNNNFVSWDFFQVMQLVSR